MDDTSLMTAADHAALSAESPVARALLGTPVGAEVTVTLPRGSRRYTVVRLD